MQPSAAIRCTSSTDNARLPVFVHLAAFRLPAALATVERMPMPWAGTGDMMNTAAVTMTGNRLNISFRGAVAPAETPVTMISQLSMEPASAQPVYNKECR
jgi:hypothetical protein